MLGMQRPRPLGWDSERTNWNKGNGGKDILPSKRVLTYRASAVQDNVGCVVREPRDTCNYILGNKYRTL
jgi:hypothetical protein